MFYKLTATIILVWVFSAGIKAAENLPVIEIQGRQFYSYTVKKGESVYGISKQNDWDLDTLRKYNENIMSGLKKGGRLFYPVVDRNILVKEINGDKVHIPLNPAHIVVKGETVYGIAKLYNISVDDIYSLNPKAKFGINVGESLKIPQQLQSLVQYTIVKGDTPYSVARKFNTNVSDLYSANPGISDSNFKYDNVIRIPVNSNESRVRKETVVENTLQGFKNYKVGSKESWNGISNKLGVDSEELKKLNSEVEELKKGTVISVPRYAEQEVEKTYIEEDPREKTEEGRNEIYMEVAKSRNITPGHVRMAVILDDPSTRRDLELSRGLLVSLNNHKNKEYDIDFKIINGKNQPDSILTVLGDYHPNLIITSSDNLPDYLVNFSKDNSLNLLNTFDMKSNSTSLNPYAIRFMCPSDIFNMSAIDYILNNYKDRKFVFVGDISGDEIGESLDKNISSSQKIALTPAELADYLFYNNENYLIYCNSNDKAEITNMLDIIYEARLANPLSDFTVVGKPNWIMFGDNLGDKFSQTEVIIPSRFYFDSSESDSKVFMNEYKEMFNHPPYKSYPLFSVAGYDIGNYFFDYLGRNGGDFYDSATYYPSRMLQTDINLKRMNNNEGLINTVCYILKYLPGNFVEKIKINK